MYKIRIKYFLAGFTVVVVLIGLFVIAPTFLVSGAASTEDNILISARPPLDMATFVDNATKADYSFRLVASEEDGKVTFYLEGPTPMDLCSAHGPSAYIDFGEIPDGGDPYEYDYSGNYPFAVVEPDDIDAIECGTAQNMEVSIDGCQADIEFHGYIHSDYPLVTYMGMMTTDVSINIGSDPEDNKIDITVFTPKEKIKLGGNFLGDVEMENCPYVVQGE
jgi:hypothetical protein